METDLATLGIFFAAAIALYIAPGPDMIYVASRAMGQGRRAGIVSALGVATGLICHMLAAAFGLAALLQVWPAAFAIVKWAGIGYLVFLGLKAFTGNADGLDVEPSRRMRSSRRLYAQGLLVNLLNPKIALFFLAFLPQFADPAKGDMTLQMLFYGALFNVGGLPWIMVIACLFGAAGNWLADRPGVLRWQKWITGSSMLGLAAFVAFEDGAPSRR